MKDRKKNIYFMISIVAVIFPIGFLLNIISAKIAFPIIFTLLGCQQLFNGLFIVQKNSKTQRTYSIVFGILFIVFGIFIVMPTYYF